MDLISTDRSFINKKRPMPGIYFDRSVDSLGGPPPGGAPFRPPMWLIRASSTEIYVTAATVNGLTPTDIATAIDISASSTTWNIYLHATLGADGIPTAVEVVASTSAIPADDDDNAYLQIGTAVVTAGVISSVTPTLAWSQTFVACGRDPADPAVTPGTYYWQVA